MKAYIITSKVGQPRWGTATHKRHAIYLAKEAKRKGFDGRIIARKLTASDMTKIAWQNGFKHLTFQITRGRWWWAFDWSKHEYLQGGVREMRRIASEGSLEPIPPVNHRGL